MQRALFLLSLGKTRFLIGTIYESLRKKLNLKSLLTSLRAQCISQSSQKLKLQYLSDLEEMLKINLPTHLTYPPDFISSKWLTILFFNILRNKELTTFQGIFFFFFQFLFIQCSKTGKILKVYQRFRYKENSRKVQGRHEQHLVQYWRRGGRGAQ